MLNEFKSSFEARMQHLRAGVRLNSRVNIIVEWTEGGQHHSEKGYTIDVSPKDAWRLCRRDWWWGRNCVCGTE